MKEIKFTKVVRIIFGILLVVMGLNIFFQFSPEPVFNERAMAFLGALFAAGYIFPVMAMVFILTGLFFLINKCAPFGAVLIAPFSLNFIFFHLFLDMTGWYAALIMVLINSYLLGAYWTAYKPMCG